MQATLALSIVRIAAFLLCLFTAWGAIEPGKVIGLVERLMGALSGFYLAVSIRLIMGVALIIGAPASRLPTVLLVVGWIVLAAAVGVIFIGRPRLRRFVEWWIGRLTMSGVRAWMLAGFAFGGWLLYATS